MKMPEKPFEPCSRSKRPKIGKKYCLLMSRMMMSHRALKLNLKRLWVHQGSLCTILANKRYTVLVHFDEAPPKKNDLCSPEFLVPEFQMEGVLDG
jgi:hypothetical protein